MTVWMFVVCAYLWPAPDEAVVVMPPDPVLQQFLIDYLASKANGCRTSLFTSCEHLLQDT